MYISDLFTYNTIFVGNQTFECIIVSFGFLSCKFCVCLLHRPPSSQDVLDCLFSTLKIEGSYYSNYDILMFITQLRINFSMFTYTHIMYSREV